MGTFTSLPALTSVQFPGLKCCPHTDHSAFPSPPTSSSSLNSRLLHPLPRYSEKVNTFRKLTMDKSSPLLSPLVSVLTKGSITRPAFRPRPRNYLCVFVFSLHILYSIHQLLLLVLYTKHVPNLVTSHDPYCQNPGPIISGLTVEMTYCTLQSPTTWPSCSSSSPHTLCTRV